jgi:hypothetical protein
LCFQEFPKTPGGEGLTRPASFAQWPGPAAKLPLEQSCLSNVGTSFRADSNANRPLSATAISVTSTTASAASPATAPLTAKSRSSFLRLKTSTESRWPSCRSSMPLEAAASTAPRRACISTAFRSPPRSRRGSKRMKTGPRFAPSPAITSVQNSPMKPPPASPRMTASNAPAATLAATSASTGPTSRNSKNSSPSKRKKKNQKTRNPNPPATTM